MNLRFDPAMPLAPPDALFRLYVWPDRLLLLGPAFDTDFHRHHAAQLCVGLDAPLRLRTGADAPWRQSDGFFVAPDGTHQFDTGGSAVALLYVDGESADCRRRWPRGAAVASTSTSAPASASAETEAAAPLDVAAFVEPLRQLWQAGGDITQAGRLAQQLLGRDMPTAGDAAQDPRLRAAADWIAAHLQSPIRIAEVAAAAHVSESHLAHLFSARIGLPLRRYVLWRRLRAALEQAMHGATLTAAAHEAGFADSAHLSRTFRENFGVAPSFLFEHRARLDLQVA